MALIYKKNDICNDMFWNTTSNIYYITLPKWPALLSFFKQSESLNFCIVEQLILKFHYCKCLPVLSLLCETITHCNRLTSLVNTYGIFWNFWIWLLVILMPVEMKLHIVPHLKAFDIGYLVVKGKVALLHNKILI